MFENGSDLSFAFQAKQLVAISVIVSLTVFGFAVSNTLLPIANAFNGMPADPEILSEDGFGRITTTGVLIEKTTELSNIGRGTKQNYFFIVEGSDNEHVRFAVSDTDYDNYKESEDVEICETFKENKITSTRHGSC